MSITINTKQDCSYLFSSLNRSSNNSNSFYGINLADYASIKNGSYGKALKAYYKENDSDNETSVSGKTNKKESTDITVKKELTNLQTYANELSDSASALMQRGSKSVFKDEDMEKVYDAVSSFTEDYNVLIQKGQNSSSSSIIKETNSLINTVEDYESSLKEIGITIGEDNKLAVDKDTFMNADMDKVKTLFNGNSSLSYLVSMRAVSIGNTAYSESNQSSLYSANGTYSTPSTGDLFSGLV